MDNAKVLAPAGERINLASSFGARTAGSSYTYASSPLSYGGSVDFGFLLGSGGFLHTDSRRILLPHKAPLTIQMEVIGTITGTIADERAITSEINRRRRKRVFRQLRVPATSCRLG